MNDFTFDLIQAFIDDDDITDINYNGKDLWIDHLEKGRYSYSDFYTESEFIKLCQRFSNVVNSPFNPQKPFIETEYGSLRISIIHPSVSGRISLSIRKTPALMRINEANIRSSNYMSPSALRFLKYCMRAHCNVMVSGLPGAGKTELIKFLTSYIDTRSRVITIEDTKELHYQTLFPGRDSVSLKVGQCLTYDQAIKISLRQRPNWLLVSEVRGEEVMDLLKSISTGTHLVSTIHAAAAAVIPKRMLYMIPQADLSSEFLLEQLYDAIHVGVHVASEVSDSNIRRYIREIVVFTDHQSELVYHHKTQRVIRKIPDSIKRNGADYGVKWE